MTELQPRELPAGGGFTVPHVQCMQAARLFLAQLETAEARVQEKVQTAKSSYGEAAGIIALTSLDVQVLSETVQIYAAMVVESAINLYGVLALGEREFDRRLGQKPVHVKLRAIMKMARERPIAPDSELTEIASRLARARNSFVHPKPREIAPVPSRTVARGVRSDVATARRAVDDAARFLHLLRTRDRDYYAFFAVF